jgi:hypothetical protein
MKGVKQRTVSYVIPSAPPVQPGPRSLFKWRKFLTCEYFEPQLRKLRHFKPGNVSRLRLSTARQTTALEMTKAAVAHPDLQQFAISRSGAF